ncbi:hypothetical protein SAMN05877753_111158 [Bacillus oleivorans]|uniref:SPP1 Gp6-like portal protein n=1 Tax=Bacillus oleivorans TaxID=1448271 RepID=A0A285D802_9BACI|nr:hypothetical protein [Bacillus oleivorans]SNX75323.1 hypothetical protein SAMN05877753_111158 [Bacillus oleivorans]
MAKLEKLLDEASRVENEYKEGISYKKQMGFLDKWAEYERMRSGDQWPRITERTKNLPRPVFNIIRRIENHKVASVMNENIKMVFSASEITDEESPEYQAADLFTRYADTTWELVKQQELNEEALESASNVGTGIWHYYYDTSKKGGNTLKYDGMICGEVIDPVNFFPGNPQNRNVQQQPYIIITYRDLVENVRKQAKDNGVSNEIANMIKPDSEVTDQAYDMAQQELTTGNKVTVLTKYWKENGTVHFMKVASGIVVKPKTNTNMKLYPLAVMQWERRKQSIFGIGDTEGLIPNQKAINFLMAMQLLSAQQTGWPKLIIDKTLVHQQITNTPGEVINVNSQTGSVGNAIQYLTPPSMPSHVPNLVEAFLSYTKDSAGANENALGEQNTSQLNASAIMLLQKAAGVPLESIKRRFYQAMEDIGNIWAEMWKVYYNTDRMITVKDDDGEEQSEIFNGSQHRDLEMRLKIDIGPSSSYSETLMMTSLDKLFDAGHITLDQYLMFVPKNVIPFKDRLLKSIEEQREMAAIQQEQQFEQLLAQLPPEEQQAFMMASPEQQQLIKQQILGQQTPQGQPMAM